MSASASASIDLRTPMLSASSSASRMPAVSTSRTGMPPMETVSLTRSRVVPGVAVTMARSRSTSRLNRLDLPTLGAADDGQRQAFMHDFAEGEAGQQFLQRRANGGDARQDLLVGDDGDIVFGEVDAGFHGGDQLDQLLLGGLQALGKCAFQLPRRDLRLVERLRIDEVAHRLGLRQIDAAVEEGAHGELARLGQPRAAQRSPSRPRGASTTGEPWQEISTTSSVV